MNRFSFSLLKLYCFCIKLRFFIGKKLLQIIDCDIFLLRKFVLYWTSLLSLQFLFDVNFLSLHLITLKLYLLGFSFYFAGIIKYRLIFFLHHEGKILSEIRYKWTLIMVCSSIQRNITVSLYSWVILSFSILSWFFLKSPEFFLNWVELFFCHLQFSSAFKFDLVL